MQKIGELNEKLDLLIKEYRKCREENRSLRKKVSEQESALEALNQEIALLKKDNELKKLATGLNTEEAKEKMSRQINQVIREIDQLLINLNEA